MRCFKCGFENANGSRFCADCGRSFQSSQSRRSVEEWPKPATIVFCREVARAAHEQSVRFARVGAPLLTSVAIGVIWHFHLSSYWYAVAGGLGFIWLAGCGRRIRGSEVEDQWELCFPHHKAGYLLIPEAVDKNGRIRCIFCGSHGVRTHGEHKTTNQHSKCTRCAKYFVLGLGEMRQATCTF